MHAVLDVFSPIAQQCFVEPCVNTPLEIANDNRFKNMKHTRKAASLLMAAIIIFQPSNLTKRTRIRNSALQGRQYSDELLNPAAFVVMKLPVWIMNDFIVCIHGLSRMDYLPKDSSDLMRS